MTGGSGTANFIPKWTGRHSQGNSTIFQSSASNVGIGTTTPSAKLDVRGNTGISGTFGLRATGTATPAAGFSSHPFDQTVSVFSSDTGTAVNRRFRWRVLAFGNNSRNPSGRLDLQYGMGTSTPVHTGLSIARDGTLTISTNNAANFAGLAVRSRSTSVQNVGVIGVADSPGGIGIFGGATNPDSSIGVFGISEQGFGVFGQSDTGTAGFFLGDVQITGTLTKAAGSFKIDHPLDPRNKYLSHSFVESPDMKNVYDGVTKLDASGEAWVQMPEWFEALNRDFRYQLTAVGAPGPNLHVARKISGNRFKIAGGIPHSEVSWQVTGIRADVYANAHRVKVEEAKPASERGRYLYPELHGTSEEKKIAPEMPAELLRQNKLAASSK